MSVRMRVRANPNPNLAQCSRLCRVETGRVSSRWGHRRPSGLLGLPVSDEPPLGHLLHVQHRHELQLPLLGAQHSRLTPEALVYRGSLRLTPLLAARLSARLSTCGLGLGFGFGFGFGFGIGIG